MPSHPCHHTIASHHTNPVTPPSRHHISLQLLHHHCINHLVTSVIPVTIIPYLLGTLCDIINLVIPLVTTTPHLPNTQLEYCVSSLVIPLGQSPPTCLILNPTCPILNHPTESTDPTTFTWPILNRTSQPPTHSPNPWISEDRLERVPTPTHWNMKAKVFLLLFSSIIHNHSQLVKLFSSTWTSSLKTKR